MRYTVHDCYVSVFGRTPSELEISKLVSDMPADIWEIGEEWGSNDKIVRELVCNWLQEIKKQS